jgi:general secretion pathway protein M
MNAAPNIAVPAAWAQRWSILSGRQRTVILAGAGILIVALLFAYVWLPLQHSRSDNAARLPELRARLAEMQRQAEELQRIRAVPPAAASLRPLDAQALRSAFSGSQVSVTVLDRQRFRFATADTGYAIWIDELNRLQAQSAARVEEATLSALAQPGRIRVEVTFNAIAN